MTQSGRIRRKRDGKAPLVATAPALPDPRQLALALLQLTEPDSPTLDAFWPRWITDYAKANRQKPRGIAAKESILRVHLVPAFGSLPMNRLTDEHVQALKASLSEHSAKTANNVLTCLGKLLRVAVRWRVLSRMPVTIELLKTSPPIVSFYDFEEYARLVEAAGGGDSRALVVAALGAEAGLRLGEMIGLEWADLDFKRELLLVRRSVSQGETTTPKSGQPRVVPLTRRLHDVLSALYVNHAGPRVLVRDDGEPTAEQSLRTWISHAQKAAGLGATAGQVHILRHTFCSHLAMKGAPLIAIKELAGHESERTTMRYMHLSPSEKTRAIDLLNTRDHTSGKPGPSSSGLMSPTGFEFHGSETESVSSGTVKTVEKQADKEARGEAGCSWCAFFRAPCEVHSPGWSPTYVGKIR